MADDLEEKPSCSQNFANTTASIFDTFNKLKKWREEQFEQFRNLQYLESQKVLRLSGESQKHFEKLLGNASKNVNSEERPKNRSPEDSSFSSLKNDLENYDTLQESSLTGHLKRCFDDSLSSSLVISENKGNQGTKETTVFNDVYNSQNLEQNVNVKQDQQVKNVTNNSVSTKQKRPFLKKGEGLLRYMPKSSPNDQQRIKKGPYTHNIPVKRSACLNQKSLKLKPAIRKTDIPSENVKHIRFDIPVISNEGSGDSLIENYLPKASELFENKIDDDDTKDKSSSLSSISPVHSPERNKFEGAPNSKINSLNLSNENKELEEFEMLENCVQNSSFNSDSSVVQRILHGDTTKTIPVQKEIWKPSLTSNVSAAFKETYKNPSETSIFSAKVGLSKCLEEAHARKEILHKVISDINPRILSLQEEITRSRQEAVDDSDISERCSTPVENLNMQDRITPTLLESCSDVVSSDIQMSLPTALPARFVDDDDEICQTHCKSCNIDDDDDLLPHSNNLPEEDFISEESDVEAEKQQALDERSKIRSKLKELEKEIAIYQELNSKLSSNCKERNEFLKKLQKEREEFYKFKEAEKKKLEDEINEERRQIKRQKETFNRYQKLRKDNPTRKEREELNALRQEIEKLQEELKRQKIKYTSDSRRWKNQLEVAERERDSFKMENIRLEEQCQDLLSALKTRIKKRPNAAISDKTDSGTGLENLTKVAPVCIDAECQTDSKYFSSEQSKNSKKASSKNTVKKTQVRFNLSTEHQKNELENVSEDIEDRPENVSKDDSQPSQSTITIDHNQDRNVEKNTEVNLSTISVSADYDFKEIDHGHKMERLYDSGEREIIFNSGTRKTISVDGKVKFLFYNGDVKEIFPDKREIYRYVNGITETHFPDGIEVTEFPNGHIQKRFPSGQKEVTFTDGTVHNTFVDGSEEVRSADGNVVTVGADGTKTIQFANGQKEIRTATYKRREFPDGAVKILYDSGRQETRYPNGRIRLKDKEGKVLFDTKYL